MVSISLRATDRTISDVEVKQALAKSIEGRQLGKVLLLPPDMTRLHSYANRITEYYYNLLKDSCQVDIMPALGTHDAMTEAECRAFFGADIPYERFVPHRWRDDIVKIGTVPADFIRDVSDGLLDYPIDVEVNRRILDPSYDLIISLGQVLPHEVVGMANYSKNIFVGCGGESIINRSHFLGAVYGMEKMMGRDHTPVRKVLDYAEKNFIQNLPILYVLTVTTVEREQLQLEGLYIGRQRVLFERAVEQSQARNICYLDRAPKKVVVYLNEQEFKSTWLGNKAVYRTRMAIADGGELVILAPGVKKFGEDEQIDQLIRKYGYSGRLQVLADYKASDELKNNMSAAAHLIHGSSDDRFTITYAVRHMDREQIEGVGFRYLSLDEALKSYPPDQLEDGWNTLANGEEIYYISNPAIGLWADRNRFEG